MGILARLLAAPTEDTQSARAPVERRADSFEQVLLRAGWGQQTAAGVSVTEEGSLSSTAVYAAVRVLSESVASLPLILYERRADGGKTRGVGHPLYGLLHDAPNNRLTAFELRELMQSHLLLWGNAYAEIEYNRAGQVVALWPLRPDQLIEVARTPDGRLAYHWQMPDKSDAWLPPDSVWHLRGLGSDGVMGYSPIQLMRQAIGLAMATERYGAAFFGNGARPGGVLQHPGVLSEDAYNRLITSWEATHQGLNQAQRIAILEEGLTYEAVGIPPEDAQFLETRRFQVEEIARAFRVPLHMLGDLSRATFSNIEHQSIDFVVHSLRPWLVRWEQSIATNLLLERERSRYFAEFLVDGLLRGDIMSRYQAYAVGRINGWLSANEVRRFENLDPLPAETGDIYLTPLNMAPADLVNAGATGQRDEGARETRAQQVGQARQALMESFLPLFEDGLGRGVRREVQDVRRLARKHLRGGRDSADFLLALDEMYQAHEAYLAETLRAPFEVLAAAIARDVMAELGRSDPATLDNFVRAYVETYASRYTTKQRLALVELIRRALRDSAEPLEAVEARLTEWEQARPELEARREAHRMTNAAALAGYTAYRVLMRWTTLGDNCQFCNNLSGRVIGAGGAFVPAGGALEDGQGGIMPISIRLGHPPAHDGCNCMILAA